MEVLEQRKHEAILFTFKQVKIDLICFSTFSLNFLLFRVVESFNFWLSPDSRFLGFLTDLCAILQMIFCKNMQKSNESQQQ